MCGIAGCTIFHESKENIRTIIEAMTNSLVHRGPDDQGVYIDNMVALGSRRLSIIDVEGGKMPISNEDESLWIVFNGEIYNFPQLRNELKQSGHIFTTRTDTEVIVHLYEEYGADCVKKLNGMFAFALWDKKNQTLLLARDRIGIKPLHYIEYPGGIIFASEIKALLQHPSVPRHLNLHALGKYLTFEYVPAPDSILNNIKKLNPGHILICRPGNVGGKKYWDIPIAESPLSYWPETEAREELLKQLQESVRKRLISDVPIGVLLSGGIDSSTIAYMAAQQTSSPIKSFSIGFEERSFDETEYSQKVAHLIGSDHHHEILSSQKMLALLPQIIEILDEPMADASIIPTYLLSKMTSQSVKVALGGDGADELFAGYPTYQAHKLVTYYSILPYRVRALINSLAKRLPVSHQNISLDFKLKQFLKGVGVSYEIGFFLWMSAFLEREKHLLLSEDVQVQIAEDNPFDDIVRYVHESKLIKELERILYLSMKLYLQDDILLKVDRASMANSLEVRVPYLDHTFVEFVAGLPTIYKLNGLRTKYILKKAVHDILPKDIVYRKKKGFGIPLSKWFNHELRELLVTYLHEKRIKQAGLFNYTYINRLLDEHFAHKRDNRKQLWTLLVFEMWREHYLK